jgi:hypothetical protein
MLPVPEKLKIEAFSAFSVFLSVSSVLKEFSAGVEHRAHRDPHREHRDELSAE